MSRYVELETYLIILILLNSTILFKKSFIKYTSFKPRSIKVATLLNHSTILVDSTPYATIGKNAKHSNLIWNHFVVLYTVSYKLLIDKYLLNIILLNKVISYYLKT